MMHTYQSDCPTPDTTQAHMRSTHRRDGAFVRVGEGGPRQPQVSRDSRRCQTRLFGSIWLCMLPRSNWSI